MSLDSVATGLMMFVGLYPVVSSGLWIAGALVFRLFDERTELEEPQGGWPGVTVLIPAHNEEQVIATSVRAALGVDYPTLEVLVLDDGSEDGTAGAAEAAGAGDDRLRVIRDAVNLGKAERLNGGFELASHELVAATDADAHVHPLALRMLVARIARSERVAAVAGAPHVTNRQNLLCALQVIEEASIVGLIRRTQAVGGRVGVVAGVLGLFRRDAVLGVGGYRGEMATEDIELSVRLLLAGWLTSYEPRALVGMEVPSDLRTLWAQRRRWARGQGEVMHEHAGAVLRWRNRRLWPLALEAIGSTVWVVLLVVSTGLVTIAAVDGGGARVGRRDGRRRDPADVLRAVDRHRLRPPSEAGPACRGALSARLLGAFGRGRAPVRGGGVGARAGRRPRGVGRPERARGAGPPLAARHPGLGLLQLRDTEHARLARDHPGE